MGRKGGRIMRLTGTCTGQYGDRYDLYLDYDVNSQSIVNNRSNVTLRMWARSSSSSYGAYNLNKVNSYAVKIDGVNKSSGKKAMDFRNRAVVELGSWTGNVAHKTDGTKTIKISGEFEIIGASSLSGGTVSSYSWSLPTIPRASSLTSFSINSNLKPGVANRVNLSISRPTGSTFTHDISLRDGTTTIASWSNQTTPSSLAISSAQVNTLLDRMSTVTSKTLTLRVQTKSGSTNIGSAVTRTAKATVDSSVKPAFDTITHSEAAEVDIGAYVQTRSKLDLAITGATGVGGATVKSYSITFEGKTYATRTSISDFIKGNGEIDIVGKVTDSRGRSTSKTVKVNVLPYRPPIITKFDIERCNEDGELDLVGNYVRILRDGNVSSLVVDDEQKNSLTYRIRTRQREDVIWLTAVEETLVTGYAQSGHRISPAISLSAAEPSNTSKISWDATTPSGTSIVMETALSLDGITYGAWQQCANGGAIPGLTASTDLSSAYLRVKTTFTTTHDNIAPKLHDIFISIGEESQTQSTPPMPEGSPLSAPQGSVTPTPEQYFTFDSETQTITGYDIAGGLDVVIPQTISGLQVLHIGGNAFGAGASPLPEDKITSVVLPEGLLTIKSPTLFDGIMNVGAFYNNSITELVIPDSVTSIGNSAFAGNYITKATLPASVAVGTDIYILGNYKLKDFYVANNRLEGIYTYDTQSQSWSFETLNLSYFVHHDDLTKGEFDNVVVIDNELTLSGSESTEDPLLLVGGEILGSFPITSSFDFHFEISDIFNTTISEAVLPTGEVPMAWDRHGIGIGKFREQGRLDVLGDIFSNGINITDSSIEMMGETIYGNYICWNNGLQVCWIFQPSWPGSATNQTHGQEYCSDKLRWTYPKPFIENPVFVGGASGQREVKSSTNTGQGSSTGIPFRLHRALTSNIDADVWLIAVGWWKEPGT